MTETPLCCHSVDTCYITGSQGPSAAWGFMMSHDKLPRVLKMAERANTEQKHPWNLYIWVSRDSFALDPGLPSGLAVFYSKGLLGLP